MDNKYSSENKSARDLVDNNRAIEVDPNRFSGMPVIKGTRFPVPQLIVEIGEGEKSIKELAENYDLDFDKIQLLFHDLADYIATAKIKHRDMAKGIAEELKE